MTNLTPEQIVQGIRYCTDKSTSCADCQCDIVCNIVTFPHIADTIERLLDTIAERDAEIAALKEEGR